MTESRSINDIKLKVCGMKYADNIQALLENPPDFMGLIFYRKSPRFMEETLDPDVIRSITQTQKTGVFVNATVEEVKHSVYSYGLDLVQLHGSESPKICEDLQKLEVGVIKVFSIGDGFDFDRLSAYEPFVDYFLFDTKGKHPGGNGVVFNWDILPDYPSNIPFFLSGGISLDHLDRLAGFHHPLLFAIDVNSQFETAPGMKNIPKIRQLQQQLPT